MQCNSLEFLIFVPIVFLIYWNLRTQLLRNVFLIISSYCFYAFADVRFTLLLFFISLLAYYSGNSIIRGNKRDRIIIGINVVVDLAVLFIFKYFNFFSENFTTLLQSFGIKADDFTLKLIIPAGLSFYTFMAISYVIDCYRKKFDAPQKIISFFAYISFFPHLLVGPIDRGRNIIPQLSEKKGVDRSLAVDGLRQFLWGLFAKNVIADNCAIVVNEAWNNLSAQNTTMLIYSAVLYSIQIYSDFSGYSNMAIGVGKLFGVRLMQNFNYPYFTRNVTEFWRKWHISLTSWFTEYVYIPLGGNRKGQIRTIINTLIVFTLCGFWHGADWTFILWGFVNGCFLIPILLQKNPKKYKNEKVFLTWKTSFQMLFTFCLITFTWIMFRADNITELSNYFFNLFTNIHFGLPKGKLCFLSSLFFMLFEWYHRNKDHGLDIVGDKLFKYRAFRWLLYYAVILSSLFLAGTQSDFIYFQF